MSRIHLTSNTLLLWLSLSAAGACSALVSVGCSSSDVPSTTPGAAGKGGAGHSGGAPATDDGGNESDAGQTSTGGVPDETEDPGEGSEGGRVVQSGGGKGGKGGSGGAPSAGGTGSAAGGSSNTAEGGKSGETEDPGEGGAGGAPDTVDPEITAAQARALDLINSLTPVRRCSTCHDATYRGVGFYPNITPDVETGIGSWSEDDIKVAIRDGKDKDGKTLCATMERYPFSEAQLSDLAIFLKHIPPVSKKITSKCPSL